MPSVQTSKQAQWFEQMIDYWQFLGIYIKIAKAKLYYIPTSQKLMSFIFLKNSNRRLMGHYFWDTL